MPLNESWRPSNLSTKQQHEAMTAIYGLGEREESMVPQELTYDERQRMRQHLDELDKKEAAGLGEFDLNKPPATPYVYREYPMWLYRDGGAQQKLVHNYDERQASLEQGWSVSPAPPPAPPEPAEVIGPDGLTASERAEAEAIDIQLKKKRS